MEFCRCRKKKEKAMPTNKLPAVPESVLKRRKRRESAKAARIQVSIKVRTKFTTTKKNPNLQKNHFDFYKSVFFCFVRFCFRSLTILSKHVFGRVEYDLNRLRFSVLKWITIFRAKIDYDFL